MDVGGVGGLRNVKNAISVARKVLENTKHSLLGGDLAADFAEKMKFRKESLQTNESKQMWTEWKANNCQPNFWKVHLSKVQLISSYNYLIDVLLYIMNIFRMLCQIQRLPVGHIVHG